MVENEGAKEVKAVECPMCGTLFKNRAGLAGHMRIEHGVEKKKTLPDEIGRRLEGLEADILPRLEAIENRLTGTIDPEKIVDSEEQVENALELLLPAAKKYGLVLGPYGKDQAKWWQSAEYEWIVTKKDKIKSHVI